jgi:tRNA modification GTPase
MTNDTIAAIATPLGNGGIAVIRISGALSVEIADKLFKGASSIKDAADRYVHLGYIYRDDQKTTLIDQVLATKFIQPHSYTGEDVVEISCHGGMFVVHEILASLLAKGARLADPGEFTKRSFLNGKIDLVQAEAVADIINAQTMASLKLAQSQRNGRQSIKLMELKEKLKKQLVLLEIELDFSEEDIKFVGREQIIERVEETLVEINKLRKTYDYGKILRDGIHTVLVGKPNVGKSSILNRLLDEDRAIVSAYPGTTRDNIEEALDIQGYLFKVTDTAGIRSTVDQMEQEGVNRTKRNISNADLIYFIIDAKDGMQQEDELALQTVQELAKGRIYLLVNKIDMTYYDVPDKYEKHFIKTMHISAKTGEGFTELEKSLIDSYFLNVETTDVVINKLRHQDALRQAEENLLHALQSIKERLSEEFISMDLRGALHQLGKLTGEITTEEILDDIFSGFCIGK